MPSYRAPALTVWVPSLLLATAITIIAMFLGHEWTRGDWSAPWDLFGDPIEVYARIQVASEQPVGSLLGHPAITRLGAPLTADWTAYPTPDRGLFVFTGVLAPVVGLFAATKLTALLLQIAAGVSFFLCARYLRWRVEWALLGGLLFAFASYQIRYANTLSLSQTFPWPPLVLLCAVAVQRAPLASRRWLLLAVALGLWFGQANPYFSYFAGYLTAATLLFALVRRVPAERRRLLLAFLLALVGSFALAHATYFKETLEPGHDDIIERAPSDAVRFALMPQDWFAPPPEHRWPAVAQPLHQFMTAGREKTYFQPAYLGLAGIIGLGLLLASTMRRLARRQTRPIPPALLGLAAVLLLAVPYGLNTWIAYAGIEHFRATNRISILVTVWTLFWFVGTLHRFTFRWPRWISVGACMIAGGVTLSDILPHFEPHATRTALIGRWGSLVEFTRVLERELGPGARLFQLPVRQFPEAGRIAEMRDYVHFQPFLVPSSLRFSYGALSATRLLGWQQHVARQPAAELAAAAARQGFSALWINTTAYPDRAASLAGALGAAGLRELPAPANLPLRVFRLTPAKPPAPIDWSDIRFNRPWSHASDLPSGASWHALDGWHPLEESSGRSWRWAGRHGSIGIWWPAPAQPSRLRTRLTGHGERKLSLHLNGTWVAEFDLPGDRSIEVDLVVPLRQGSNVLEMSINRPPTRPPGDDPRLLGFAVENLSFTPAP